MEQVFRWTLNETVPKEEERECPQPGGSKRMREDDEGDEDHSCKQIKSLGDSFFTLAEIGPEEEEERENP